MKNCAANRAARYITPSTILRRGLFFYSPVASSFTMEVRSVAHA